MGQGIPLAKFRRWLLVYADRIAQHEAYLTQLDAAIGDADHGINLMRGMLKVRERLTESGDSCEDVGALFRTVAMTLISHVGGASGPLYGAFFLRAAKESNGDVTVDLVQLAAMFRHGLEGIQQRGKALAEEKTMIDAIMPAVEALEVAAAEGRSISSALASASQAAETGMKHTTDLQASKGRASYLGSRSIGHQDPGATSAYYLFQTAAETLNEEDV
jgi:phosphoenolpyruvate---glycerone phosphotransferase subunit DhaL